MANKTVKIYGLVDPRDGEIRYIGRTKRTLAKRKLEHLQKRRLKKKILKNKWLNELLKEGLEPNIVLLYECLDEPGYYSPNKLELRTIWLFELLYGNLTNSIYKAWR